MIAQYENLLCCFCQSTRLKLTFKNEFHKFKKDHGPINFYRCLDCQSGFTYPLPDKSALSSLYASFAGGMIPETRDIRNNNPLHKWYNQCVDRATDNSKCKLSKDEIFNWIDIGAGGGEVAKIMAERYPNSKGVAIDYHSKPDLLSGLKNVAWVQCDLNEKEFYRQFPRNHFQVALCITVLEHVLFPYEFIGNILKLLASDGSLYLTVPDIGSVAAKSMHRFWPYYIFGEHLHIPSKTGMRVLLKRHQAENALSKKKMLIVAPVVLPYPITYYLDHFRMKYLSRLFSAENTIPVNTGIMEAIIQ